MFSLIITIVSVALVTALALATIYYGGSAFKQGKAEAFAAKAVLQGQQLQGAAELFQANNGRWPHDLTELVSANYLNSIPTADATKTMGVVANAYAANLPWQMPTVDVPTFTLAIAADEAACQSVNLKSYGYNGILRKAYTGYQVQCYGYTDGGLLIVATKTPQVLPVVLKVGDVVAGSPVSTTGPDWLVEPSATAPVVAGPVTPPAPAVAPSGNDAPFVNNAPPATGYAYLNVQAGNGISRAGSGPTCPAGRLDLGLAPMSAAWQTTFSKVTLAANSQEFYSAAQVPADVRDASVISPYSWSPDLGLAMQVCIPVNDGDLAAIQGYGINEAWANSVAVKVTGPLGDFNAYPVTNGKDAAVLGAGVLYTFSTRDTTVYRSVNFAVPFAYKPSINAADRANSIMFWKGSSPLATVPVFPTSMALQSPPPIDAMKFPAITSTGLTFALADSLGGGYVMNITGRNFGAPSTPMTARADNSPFYIQVMSHTDTTAQLSVQRVSAPYRLATESSYTLGLYTSSGQYASAPFGVTGLLATGFYQFQLDRFGQTNEIYYEANCPATYTDLTSTPTDAWTRFTRRNLTNTPNLTVDYFPSYSTPADYYGPKASAAFAGFCIPMTIAEAAVARANMYATQSDSNASASKTVAGPHGNFVANVSGGTTTKVMVGMGQTYRFSTNYEYIGLPYYNGSAYDNTNYLSAQFNESSVAYRKGPVVGGDAYTGEAGIYPFAQPF